jgi:dienelactone hydrolase
MREIANIGSNLKSFLKVDLCLKAPSYEILSETDHGTYLERLIRYPSRDGDLIPAYLLVPKRPSGTAVLIHHQHNGERHFGKSEVVGHAGNPLQAFGKALAEKGIIVLAPDSICFEDRRPNAKGIEKDDEGDFLQHFNEMTYRLVRGDTLMRKVLEDASCGLSVLLGVEGVNTNRIGVLGHSYGGNTVLFQTALDKRIQFACSSGALCSYESKMKVGTSFEFALAIPNIYPRFDFPEILKACAPRRFLVISADEDKYAKDADAVVKSCGTFFMNNAQTTSSLEHYRYGGGHALTKERFDAIIAWILKDG